MDSNIKRTIILDNYENPYNKGLTNKEDYIKDAYTMEICSRGFMDESDAKGET